MLCVSIENHKKHTEVMKTTPSYKQLEQQQ
jgi:hypothetical protein